MNLSRANSTIFTIATTVTLLVATVAGGSPKLAKKTSAAERAFFEKKIRPVLVEHCYSCHSAKAKKIGGKLRLDTPGAMREGGESGPVFVAGQPKKSVLIQALRHKDIEMPPKKQLPESVINDFVKWVEMGAPDPRTGENPKAVKKAVKPVDKKDESLWSFRQLTRPAIPDVSNADWCRDPLDRFVLAGLDAVKLKPTGDADAKALVRRLYFDLIGLPPNTEQVESFVAAHQKNGSKAVEQLVDELLASSHFGERWGRHWLDVARYGESNGNDGLSRNPTFPHAWRYRDYVIQSFNDDVAYDRFVTEQIAGDLLPARTPVERDRLLIATGFLALGSKPAKAMNVNFDMDVVDDQINVVSTAVMGLSVSCARCHDHKHDPIPTRDYYAMAGIFKSTETLWGKAANEKLTAPVTPLHVLKATPKLLRDKDGNVTIVKTRAKPKPVAGLKLPAEYGAAVEELKPVLRMGLKGKPKGRLTVESGVRFESGKFARFKSGRIRGELAEQHQAYSVAFWFRNDTDNSARPVTAYVFSRGPLTKKPGAGDHLGISGTTKKTDGRGRIFIFNGDVRKQSLLGTTMIPPRTWNHVVYVRDGKRVTGYLNGNTKPEFDGEIDRTAGDSKTFFIGARSDRFAPLLGNVGEFALFDRALSAEEALKLHEASGQPKGSGKQAPPVAGADPYQPLAMGVRDRGKVGDCKINIKGESKKLGPAVPRGFLSACSNGGATMSVDPKQSGRLQLAQWLTSGDHPQTSRVFVNRIWLHLFGRAIVETPDDFGVYGARPTHPELLDHLAQRFVSDGWSIKRMIRAIVLSRTYQLSSECDSKSQQADPDNAWFGRHHRRRLDAESLRDSILLVSGELNLKPGLGSTIQHMDVLVNQSGSLHQPSNHRSVYLCMLRNSPPPELSAFDLPDGVTPKGKRNLTTLPTQALYLINSPFVVAQSQRFATRLLDDSALDDEGRVRVAWRRALNRAPSDGEITRSVKLVKAIEDSLKQSEANPDVCRLRAWAGLCQALMATNEFRYVD